MCIKELYINVVFPGERETSGKENTAGNARNLFISYEDNRIHREIP